MAKRAELVHAIEMERPYSIAALDRCAGCHSGYHGLLRVHDGCGIPAPCDRVTDDPE
jgi:hypothetical protein